MKLMILTVVLSLAAVARAQPSDPQIQRDLGGPGVLSIKLDSGRGNVELNTETGVYEYTRVAEVRRTTTWPDVKLIIKGVAVYQKVGGGFRYWKFRVAENRYEGIPNPTQADLDAVLDTDRTAAFGQGIARSIVKVHTRPAIAGEPRWTWHEPTSVSFRMEAKIDRITSNTTVETQLLQVEVRLYRDDMKKPWQKFLAVPREHKVLATATFSADEIRNMPNIVSLAEDQAAKAHSAKLPTVQLPAFATPVEAAFYLHRVLREGPRERAEAVVRALLAPRYLAPGSSTALGHEGEQLVTRALDAAFAAQHSYARQFCAKPAHETRGSRTQVYLAGVRSNIISRFAFVPAGGGYRDGVKVGERLVLDEIAVGTTTDPDTLAWIASFTDRRKLCPAD